MSSTRPSCFLTVAYASLSSTDSQSSANFNALREFCLQIPGQVEVLAEEAQPNELSRPFWTEVLSLVEREALTTVIVPSLFHVAGSDVNRLSHFFVLLQRHGVRLLSLAEGLDSHRDTKDEMLVRIFDAKQMTSATSTPCEHVGEI